MPRAVNPKLGDDGYAGDPVRDWKLVASDVLPLVSHLAETSLDAPELAQLLSGIGAEYHRRADRGADAFTRAEAREALDVILALPSLTAHAVISLNERALSAVHEQLMMMRGIWVKGDSPIEMLYGDQLPAETLRSACQAAREKLAAGNGPYQYTALHICADELCGLYEWLTGRLVKLSNKTGENLEYSRAPCTPSGLFVYRAIELIIGGAPTRLDKWLPTKVSGYVRRWIQDRGFRASVHTSRKNAGEYRVIGCSLNQGEHQCSTDEQVPTNAAPVRVLANDQHHSRPQGRKQRDRVAQIRSEKRPDS